MIQTIHLDALLRETVPAPFGDLVTRPTGAAVRGRILQAITAATGCALTLLDFTAVRLIDFSCADEVVAKLLLAADPAVERYVVLHGLSEDQVEAIDHVLTGHRLAVAALALAQARPLVLGWATGDDRAAFDALQDAGGGDAGRVARALAWPVARARDTLTSLARRRLVRPTPTAFLPLVLP